MGNTAIHTLTYKKYFISHAYSNHGGMFQHGFGIHLNEDISKEAATAELVERNCGNISRLTTFKKLRYIDCPHKIIPLTDLMLLCNEFNVHETYSWDKVNTLKDGRQYYAPASLIYFPFSEDGTVANNFQTSVGLAAHSNPEVAVTKAIHEIIERHFLYKAWSGDTAIRKISNENGLILLTIDNPLSLHIILAVIESECIPFASIGINASIHFEEALNHAVKEAYLSEWYNQTIIKEISKREESFPFFRFAMMPFFMHAFDRSTLNTRKKFYGRALPYNVANNNYTVEDSLKHIDSYFGKIYIKKIEQNDNRIHLVRAMIPGTTTNHLMLTNHTPIPLL